MPELMLHESASLCPSATLANSILSPSAEPLRNNLLTSGLVKGHSWSRCMVGSMAHEEGDEVVVADINRVTTVDISRFCFPFGSCF